VTRVHCIPRDWTRQVPAEEFWTDAGTGGQAAKFFVSSFTESKLGAIFEVAAGSSAHSQTPEMHQFKDFTHQSPTAETAFQRGPSRMETCDRFSDLREKILQSSCRLDGILLTKRFYSCLALAVPTMERRVDPEDGRAQTLDEMLLKYKGTYSKAEIEAYFRSECKLASEGKRTSAVAAAFASKDSSEINGLEEWLREVGYEHSFQKVADWCHDNGAVLLEEVQENWEQVISDLGLEQGSCAGAHNEQAFQVAGLSAWLEEIELEDYLEDVLEWCHQHGVRDLKEIQTRWEEILQELKFKTAKEQLPGKRVSVRVLKGKWQGSYMAQAPGFDNHRYPASAYV
ncbi:unnamed protein product, partial [Symbiodinium necroappetens]